MLKFILKRILQAIPIVLATTFIAYGVIRAAPGDPVQMLVGDPKKIPQAHMEQLKKKLGLDKPWYVAYVYWLRNLIYNPPPPPIVDLTLTDPAVMEATGRRVLTLRIDPDTQIYLGDRKLSMREAASAHMTEETRGRGERARTVKFAKTTSPLLDHLEENPDESFHAVYVWERSHLLTGLFDESSANDNVVSKLFPRSAVIIDAIDPDAGTITYHLLYGDATEKETVTLDNVNVQLRINKEEADLEDFQVGQEYNLVTREQEVSKLYGLADAAGAKHIQDLPAALGLNPGTPGLQNGPVKLKTVVASPAKRFDLGESYTLRRPVTELFLEALNNTFFLVLLTLVLEFAIAIPIGIIVALKKNTIIDYFLTFLTFVMISLPSFWFALMLLMIFAFHLGWFPSGGMSSPNMVFSWGDWASVKDRIMHTVLPLTVLTLGAVAGTMRYTRAAVLDVIHQDYVRTARAKGLPGSRVIYRHVLKNALIPIITLIGLTFPFLISGSYIVEQIFSWPGMGKLS
ncbi:MAG TPA: ABC transporter permease subunit, partial [bacterium]|nr:ABC transporter permease subunit [bacterium]